MDTLTEAELNKREIRAVSEHHHATKGSLTEVRATNYYLAEEMREIAEGWAELGNVKKEKRAIEAAQRCDYRSMGIRDCRTQGIGFFDETGKQITEEDAKMAVKTGTTPKIKKLAAKKKAGDGGGKKKPTLKKIAKKAAPAAPAAPKKKVAKKKPAAATPKSKRPVGKTTGLGVHAAWTHIFEQNERAKKPDRLTDEKIAKWMYKEFPTKTTAAFAFPARVRKKYNAGGLAKGGAVPKTESRQFDEAGTVVPPKVKGE